MSLRAFHVFFISAAVILTLGTAVWCLGSAEAAGENMYRGLGVFSLLVSAALVVYGLRYVRKLPSAERPR